jgi:hypothetical protein
MTDEELKAFGKQMRKLVEPVTYGYGGKPSVTSFSIQLDEARAEWRRRYPKKRRNAPSASRLLARLPRVWGRGIALYCETPLCSRVGNTVHKQNGYAARNLAVMSR